MTVRHRELGTERVRYRSGEESRHNTFEMGLLHVDSFTPALEGEGIQGSDPDVKMGVFPSDDCKKTGRVGAQRPRDKDHLYRFSLSRTKVVVRGGGHPTFETGLTSSVLMTPRFVDVGSVEYPTSKVRLYPFGSSGP